MRGGKRPNAGRPKGSKDKATLEKEKVFAEVRQRIMRQAQRILDAQLSVGQGQTFLYKIEKVKKVGPRGGISYESKRPALVTDQREIEAYLDGLLDEGDPSDEHDPAATYYYLTTKEPNNMAIDSMLDRAFGKATQKQEVEFPDGLPFKITITQKE